MNVVHRDLKLANILINFKNIEMDDILEKGLNMDKVKSE
jgi:serine/threonine protein kinase